MDEDPFIRLYPSFESYLRDWSEMGGEGVADVPQSVVFEFYAEKVMPEKALHTWFTYDPFSEPQ